MSNYLWTGTEWTFPLVERVYEACEEIGVKELGLDIYPNQLEIITSEQMVDAYASIGLPIYYHHWSFGKHFSSQWDAYKRGHMGLAYEIVINSNPCISYLMEENTMTLQALVTAHAAIGHNHYFRNNYLFKEWTDAEGIVDYLIFAREYIHKCEVREGRENVERFLDAAHALMNYGVNRYKRPAKLTPAKEAQRQKEREEYQQKQVNELYLSLEKSAKEDGKSKTFPPEPEENVLYFCEKYAPDLPDWKREVLRIVRKVSQYFYPQAQTKTCNEGTATYVHYRIMNRLYEKGFMTDDSMLEFIQNHTNVVFQPTFDDQRYSGINPYALGFAMMQDIERICKDPTDEDRRWFPDFAGSGDEMAVLRDAWANYRDESFIRQFLSPKVIRDFGLFQLRDDRRETEYVVKAIQNEQGYQKIRDALANRYERHETVPEIEVVKVDPETRMLYLVYKTHNKRSLGDVKVMIKHVESLWGHPAVIHDEKGNRIG